MRFSKYSLIGIGIGAAIFGVLVLLQVACSSTDNGSEPSGGTGSTVGATGSTGGGVATGAGDGPFVGPIEDGFSNTPLAADETPDRPFGVVLSDVETGDGEYWRVEAATDQQGEFYGIDSGHRWLQWLDSGGQRLVVADRQTGESYELDTAAWVVVAGPSAEGVMVLQQAGGQSFAVVDLANDPLSRRLSFELEQEEGAPTIATLLGGGRAFLFGNDHIDLTTGEVTEHVLAEGGFTASFAAQDGGWLDVTFASDADVTVAAKRFDAGGAEIPLDSQRVLEVEPNAGSFTASPDGRWVGISLGLGLKSPPETSVWPTVAMADVQSGELAFRALRVSVRSGLRSLGWLPDSSGLLVATPESFGVLRTDGSIEALPFGPVEQAGVGGVPVPVVSPGDSGRYLFQGRVVDVGGEPVGPEIAAGAWASTEPWNNYGFNLDGTELRFLQSASLGRDYPLTVLTAFGLPSRIERPPFPGQLDLVVTKDTGAHPAPDATTATVAQLAPGETVTVLDEQQRQSSAWPEMAANDTDFSVFDVPWWVYVRTSTGMQGWVRTDALAWP